MRGRVSCRRPWGQPGSTVSPSCRLLIVPSLNHPVVFSVGGDGGLGHGDAKTPWPARTLVIRRDRGSGVMEHPSIPCPFMPISMFLVPPTPPSCGSASVLPTQRGNESGIWNSLRRTGTWCMGPCPLGLRPILNPSSQYSPVPDPVLSSSPVAHAWKWGEFHSGLVVGASTSTQVSPWAGRC